MNSILETLKQRTETNYSLNFYRDTSIYFIQFNQERKSDTHLTIFLDPSDLAAFLAAVASEASIFLCNDNWKKQEWDQVAKLVYPDIFVGFTPKNKLIDSSPKSHLPNTIMIPTGGTSGQIKFAIHTWKTLEASVRGFQEYYEVEKINSYCILPLYHVGGLMQFIRSWHSNGKFVFDLYSQLKRGVLPEIEPEEYFISLVPTQLQFLLNNYPEWLRRFHTVLLGGAPAWTSLLEQARQEKINLAITYGMTETASQVVALKPQEFLQEHNSNGQVLPHAKIKIDAQSQNDGTIVIEAQSLYKGYYPNLVEPSEFITDDRGYLDDNNNLFILGRNSQKIITGGENVFPQEVEDAIRSIFWVKDVAVTGITDLKWGQAIVALYVLDRKIEKDDTKRIEQLIERELDSLISKYKQPKHWIEVDEIPRNIQGKINQEQLQSIVNAYLEKNG